MCGIDGEEKRNKIYLIDGHGLIYRAYYAFFKRPLITTKGENTSAIFGFMRMILRLLKDENPRYMLCVFDSRVKTFRHEKYPEYKAKRLKAPNDLLSQIDTIQELVEKLGIPWIIKDGYEADDIIGTITLKAKEKGIKSIVVSGDKDILQLVDDSTIVYANKKGISEIEVMDRNKVEKVWGVPPERIIDLLALMGDQSDNVPGVRGIGQQTAVKLIQQFGTVENLYGNIDRVENKNIRKKLIDGKEDAFLSKELVIIRRDAPVDFDMDSYILDNFPLDEGIKILLDKELNTIIVELKGEDALEKKAETKRGKYYLVDTDKLYEELLKKIKDKKYISFDVETTGKDPVTSDIIGVSISTEEEEGYYIPIRLKTKKAMGIDFLKITLKPVLEDDSIKKIGQNIKYDFVVLLQNEIEMKGIAGDSMIAAYLLNPQKQRYKLDDLAKEYLDYTTIHYGDVVKEKENTLLDYPLEELVEYAAEDSDIALRLHNILEKKLEEIGLIKLYREIEVPLITVLGKMEHRGVRIDSDYLVEMSHSFAEEIDEIEQKIFEITGEVFNVRSTKQLSYILFEKMKLPVIKKTKTGYSTDESVLEELAMNYEIARLLLRHRRLTKLKNTYIDALPQMVNPKTGRIHTSFNQTITTTGRLSSTGPNLQNIPIREEEGRAIRKAFIPEEGWYFISADYSQIELRILASLSGDEALVKAFEKGGDVHRETASILFGVPPEEVSDEQRQAAKTINYSVIYGISPYGLSKQLGISRTQAADFINMYFDKYVGVKKFFDGLVKFAEENGYVETLLGRKRFIPEIYSKNKNLYEAARRIAINTPIQGTAADLIKKAMIIIDNEIVKRKMYSKMLIQVHDELVFESPENEYQELMKMVKDKMEHAISFKVPIVVNIAAGKNWEEAH
ncbi:MAG: DNA polymerase I [Spirochaetes bacterium]|nr:MAG: DNA polymerase I [Spirochaetota bacterium]